MEANTQRCRKAVLEDNVEAVRKILDEGAFMNEPNIDGTTALHLACGFDSSI
jgi:ankyrin repeat protein